MPRLMPRSLKPSGPIARATLLPTTTVATTVITTVIAAVVAAVVAGLLGSPAAAQEAVQKAAQQAAPPAVPRAGSPPPTMRIFWQDRQAKSLRWADLRQQGDSLQWQTAEEVAGFPPLAEPDRQELVQMERIDELLLIGVRDDDGGQFNSGWVAIDTGLRHPGTTGHNPPAVIANLLDDRQGNPAHLYVYDDQFYLANDQLNGFTRFPPESLRALAAATATAPSAGKAASSAGEAAPTAGSAVTTHFHRGGGGHITLAAAAGRVAYSTWIAGGDSPQAGRVDVVDLSRTGEDAIAYSFQLPSGGLHGAIANQGRIFLAPRDGIYWLDADLQLSGSAESVQPHQLDLGKSRHSQRSYRTGAFVNHGRWVLFSTGLGDDWALGLIDAAAAEPEVVKLPIEVADRLSLVTPRSVVTAAGKHYAFVFQDRRGDGDEQERLTVVDLDPNGDGDLSDAAVAQTLDVGGSQVDGHYGHHAIAFDDAGQYAVFSNPADGELWLLSLADLTVVSKQPVGGMPTTVLAVGTAPTGIPGSGRGAAIR